MVPVSCGYVMEDIRRKAENEIENDQTQPNERKQ